MFGQVATPETTPHPDEQQEEFRLCLAAAREADETNRERLIVQAARNPWYLRIQVNRLRKLPAAERRDALNDALILFAGRLRRDPTLGLTEATQHLLPAYVAQHARSIASSLYRTRSRQPNGVTLDDHPLANVPSVADSSVVMLIDEFRDVLREDEWFIYLLRFRMDWKREHVAAALGVTVHRVRTTEVSLRERLASFGTFASSSRQSMTR